MPRIAITLQIDCNLKQQCADLFILQSFYSSILITVNVHIFNSIQNCGLLSVSLLIYWDRPKFMTLTKPSHLHLFCTNTLYGAQFILLSSRNSPTDSFHFFFGQLSAHTSIHHVCFKNNFIIIQAMVPNIFNSLYHFQNQLFI